MSVNTSQTPLEPIPKLQLEIYIPPLPALPCRTAGVLSGERGQGEGVLRREERQEERRMVLRERKVKQAVKVYLDEVDRETSRREVRRKKPRRNEEKSRTEVEGGVRDAGGAQGKSGGTQPESVAKADNELHLQPTQTQQQPKVPLAIGKEQLKMVYKCLAELKQGSGVITSGLVRSRMAVGVMAEWQLQGCLNELDGRGKIHYDRETQTIYL